MDQSQRDKLESATRVVSKHLAPTPVIRSPIADQTSWLKLETLHPTGSFKPRGVVNALSNLSTSRRIVANSAGNHGLALCKFAGRFEVKATIIVARTVSPHKLQLIRDSGAEVVVHGVDFGESERFAREFAESSGATFVSPYNDEHVVYGQSTVGTEILEQLGPSVSVVCPVGGGGLAAGIFLSIENDVDADLHCVESSNSNPMAAAMAAGRVIPIEIRPTIAEGLAGNIEPASITYDILSRNRTPMLTVTDDEICVAMRHLAREHGILAEPAGAVAVAALLAGKVKSQKKHTVAIVSGRNVNPFDWMRMIGDQRGNSIEFQQPT